MTYGTIVVCGGGCYGGYYVRQLARARAAGAIVFEQLIVVDRDPECRVARLAAAIRDDDAAAITEFGWRMVRDGADVAAADAAYRGLPIMMACEEWSPFFDAWFSAALDAELGEGPDAVVPSPLMPNLLADWVASRLSQHRSGASVVRAVPVATPMTPWARGGSDGSHYASFATWMCPINCIEPPRCPETRGPRDWTMPVAVRDAMQRAAGAGTPYDVLALFHTTHRTYGVGMFDVADACAADRALEALDARRPARVLVASVSHCHGALAELQAAPAS